MRIASWNINSLRKRQDRLFAWLEDTQPDIVCLQETKCPDELFPALALQAAGYCSAYHGEKSYNGVAILAMKSSIRRRASSQRPSASCVYFRFMRLTDRPSGRRRMNINCNGTGGFET